VPAVEAFHPDLSTWQTMMKKTAVLVGSVLKYAVIALVIVATVGLTWLRWEAHQPRDDWFDERRGHIDSLTIEDSIAADSQLSALVTLRSDTGLSFSFRVIRYPSDGPLPVLLVLGGHRNSSAMWENALSWRWTIPMTARSG
jgi:hypothetical protein